MALGFLSRDRYRGATMNDPQSSQCPRCIQLEELVRTLTERVEALEAELARSKKDSSTSSKPPSSDLVKPPKAAPQAEGQRQQGAQRGHTRHERPLFSPQEIDTAWEYRLGFCPDCGGCVEPSTEPPRILQQVEITPRPIAISEHRGMACYCPPCHQTHFAPIDEPVVRAGLIGPRLSVLVAYLKVAVHQCSDTVVVVM
jgi:transposase